MAPPDPRLRVRRLHRPGAAELLHARHVRAHQSVRGVIAAKPSGPNRDEAGIASLSVGLPPGLSKAALDTLKPVQVARLTAEIPRGDERYDARQRRKEELLPAAWREGRADPRVANELDGFMTAASQRLGEEGALNASRATSSGRRMELPGVGREHQAGLDELAQHFAQARGRKELSTAWERQVEREAKEAERQRARAEERERRGLPREPEQDRERQRRERGLGLER